MNRKPHISVMLQECLDHFAGQKIEVFFEGTLGAAGHAQAILTQHPEIKRYIACDRDPQALEMSKQTLAPWIDKLDLIHGDFGDVAEYLEERGIENVDGFFLT